MRDSALLASVLFIFGASAALADETAVSLRKGTELNAVLKARVDSDDVKPGQQVNALIVDDVRENGVVVIPKGSKLIGRVTAAGRSSGKGMLGLAFDRAVRSDGQEVTLDVQLVALAAERPHGTARREPADSTLTTAGTVPSMVHRTGGGALETAGGVISGPEISAGRTTTTIGAGIPGMVNRSPGATGGVNSEGRMLPGSRGVFGIADVEISKADSNSYDGTILITPRSNVDLDRGVQLLLVAGG